MFRLIINGDPLHLCLANMILNYIKCIRELEGGLKLYIYIYYMLYVW